MLEIKLSEYATIIHSTHTDLNNCQKAHYKKIYNCQKARHEETAALSSAFLFKQKQHHECQQAYQSVCLQNEQMKQDIHTFTIVNLRLQQKLVNLYNSNQTSEINKISQASSKIQELDNVARETTIHIRAAELEKQTTSTMLIKLNMKELQQMTSIFEPYDMNFTKLLIEKERSIVTS